MSRLARAAFPPRLPVMVCLVTGVLPKIPIFPLNFHPPLAAFVVRVTSSFESSEVVMVSVVFPMLRLRELIDFYANELSEWTRSEACATNGSLVQFDRGASSVTVGPCVDVESQGTDINATCVSITQRE